MWDLNISLVLCCNAAPSLRSAPAPHPQGPPGGGLLVVAGFFLNFLGLSMVQAKLVFGGF